MMAVSNKTILLLDDEPAIRFSLKRYLEDQDYIIVEAGTGAQALEMLGQTTVHTAIVDLHLPDMNGETFISKAHQIAPTVNYLLFTGSWEYQLPQSLIDLGMSEQNVLFKPICDMNTFIEAIEHIGRASHD